MGSVHGWAPSQRPGPLGSGRGQLPGAHSRLSHLSSPERTGQTAGQAGSPSSPGGWEPSPEHGQAWGDGTSIHPRPSSIQQVAQPLVSARSDSHAPAVLGVGTQVSAHSAFL